MAQTQSISTQRLQFCNTTAPHFLWNGSTQYTGIIMYTDCLNESVNKNGEQFTEDRIAQAFEDAGIGSAKSKLDYVLSRFNKFTEGSVIKDDLTVIVLQYNP